MDKYMTIIGRMVIGIIGIIANMLLTLLLCCVVFSIAASVFTLEPIAIQMICCMCSSFVGGYVFNSWHRWMFGYDLN